MSEFKQLYSPLIQSAKWYSVQSWALEQTSHGAWLLESESLSRRLAQYCQHFTVTVLAQTMISNSHLSVMERQLVGDSDCLEREVMLYGDQQPWVFARTLIPMTTLSGEEKDLVNLGDIPLGYRVFNDKNSRRDALEVANLGTQQQPRWARRSRLWINEKPMLVAELFLIESPVYAKEKGC
ncbi:chorismate lyase [Photobacterium carnosum]|uniref:chorismate--pyruvate lyase family protein n=1 Tax=Photobacterium carnosum TaxID=2023717 RepID=UPI001E49984D|nr:chorismate lyase [Photobacterium carnosum]MCD9522180.1 chorismate lyase [Photobacterium carnosum]